MHIYKVRIYVIILKVFPLHPNVRFDYLHPLRIIILLHPTAITKFVGLSFLSVILKLILQFPAALELIPAIVNVSKNKSCGFSFRTYN